MLDKNNTRLKELCNSIIDANLVKSAQNRTVSSTKRSSSLSYLILEAVYQNNSIKKQASKSIYADNNIKQNILKYASGHQVVVEIENFNDLVPLPCLTAEIYDSLVSLGAKKFYRAVKDKTNLFTIKAKVLDNKQSKKVALNQMDKIFDLLEKQNINYQVKEEENNNGYVTYCINCESSNKEVNTLELSQDIANLISEMNGVSFDLGSLIPGNLQEILNNFRPKCHTLL